MNAPENISRVEQLFAENQGNPLKEVADILRPRIMACVAGMYPGGRAHALDLMAARDVIAITKTRACIVHVTRTAHEGATHCLPVTELLTAFETPDEVVPLINTSRARSSDEALRMIYQGLKSLQDESIFARDPLIKLEILDRDLNSVGSEVLRCIAALPKSLRTRCIPYVPSDHDMVSRACELGCPAVRIVAGKIGQRTGIADPESVRTAVVSAGNIPVILEGGLASREDIEMCAALGADAVLVNSAFAGSPDPRSKARELREAADRAWGHSKRAAFGQDSEFLRS
jgi:thiazole synthase ThiGH ThiG subunit